MSDTTAPHVASAQRPSHAFATLDNVQLYRVGGKDPRKFLHGQLTQHLDEVTDTRARRAAACNPKGRAYAILLLVGDQDSILLRLPTAIKDSATSQLNKFLMLFRGTDMTPQDESRIFGLWGLETACSLSPEATSLDGAGDVLTLDDGKLIRVPDTAEGVPRFEFWRLSGDRLPDAPEATTADWAAAEISAGLAELDSTSSEAYVPQMLNLQHVDGIHFKKGCYTGQEVIARMHYLGQLKKSLFRLSIDSDQPLSPGTPVIAGDKAVGELVNVVAFDDGHQEALAVLKHAALTSQPWTLEGVDGTLARQPLPYPVPEQEQS
ncbi:folate-binding protein [Marinobacter halodurans]|uniref:Folate-binding protein n=1 Tax=Marinobacter halodurans TaxID=2528979 RepID=A0ABY1ZRP6_9GAMM|nr:folate-binding protein YgfZ [Marinobacter halodurans]TBW57851.1 folate-binding protein [Marinobacter halodurans]